MFMNVPSCYFQVSKKQIGSVNVSTTQHNIASSLYVSSKTNSVIDYRLDVSMHLMSSRADGHPLKPYISLTVR